MALLYTSIGFRALDNNGDPMPFAKLYTRDNSAHSTPKATYTTSALSVANANPLVADSAGYFGQMFAQEGDVFYLILTAQGGDPNSPYLTRSDITALGSDGSGAIIRTFSNSRYKVDSGSVDGQAATIVAYGSPSPLDTGGYVREEGWAGTQGTKKVQNFALVETTGNEKIDGALEVVGALTFGGFGTPVPRVTARGAAAAVSSQVIAMDQSYAAWELNLRNLVLSTGATVTMQFSFDNGSTYKSGASDYSCGGFFQGNTTTTNVTWATASGINVLPALSSGSGVGGGAMVTSRISSKAGAETQVRNEFLHFDATHGAGRVDGSYSASTNATNYGKATHVKILVSGGTMTFDYSLMGLP